LFFCLGGGGVWLCFCLYGILYWLGYFFFFVLIVFSIKIIQLIRGTKLKV